MGSYVTIGASVMAVITARSTRTKSGTRDEKSQPEIPRPLKKCKCLRAALAKSQIASKSTVSATKTVGGATRKNVNARTVKI